METAEKILLLILNAALFVVLSIIFLPAFLIVTGLQDVWSKKLKEVLGL